MNLLWKLLRHNISVGQFCGFVFANFFGLVIILAGFQFYYDVLPIITSEDSFMKADYIMVTKRIGTGNTISGRSNFFQRQDIDELKEQQFVKKIGVFTSTNYKADAQMGVNGKQVLNTEMFFESVPDEFVDVNKADWSYQKGANTVPIILPRTYINMYNFGFARNHSLPQISDGLMGLIDFNIHIKGNGKEQDFKGRVVALSNSLSAILVPQSFMDWSNKEFAPNETDSPNRLLMEVTNPTDENMTQYFDEHGLEMESDKLNVEKTVYFLRLIVSIVIIVGLIISILSFYILVLSIYLLVQKNTEKLQNLLLIGYDRAKVSLPYQLLATCLNAIVLVVAVITVIIIRHYYMTFLKVFYENSSEMSIVPTLLLGIGIFLVITIFNTVVIRNKISRINS
jgi:hypothetical protein